jgi:phage protein D
MSDFPYYSPDFQVEINDQPIPAELRAAITGVRYLDGIDVADRVELDFANPDGFLLAQHIKGLGFRPFPTGVRLGSVAGPSPIKSVSAVPTGMFDMDNKLSLALGYAPDGPEHVFKGEITGVEAEFSNEGVPSLRLVAHDYLHRMTGGKYVRGFSILPDAIIASILAVENRLIPLIDPALAGASAALAAVNFVFSGTAGHKQKGQSHYELLKEIAETYGATFWVEDDILYLTRFFKEYSPRLTLTWGSSLITFRPKVSTVGQVVGVSVIFTLREIPLAFMVSVAYDFDREAIVISVLPGEAGQLGATGAVIGGPLLSLDRRAIGSPADIANSALALARKLRNALNNRLTGEGSTVGDPRIRAGAVIRLEGMGPDFSGDYRVVGAAHVIGSGGYRTEFKVRKEIIP